jgi:glycosyltransferase involved in cell wall biosynthesis
MFNDGGIIGLSTDKIPHVVWQGGQLPIISQRLRRWMLPLYPRAVRSLSQHLHALHRTQPLDVVVSTSSAAIKGLKAPQGVPHICYCHAPARYVWSQESEYRKGSMLRGLGLRLYRERFKQWDRATASHVTHFIANSRHTAAEIRRCYDRDSVVVHPPVRTEFFTVDRSVPRDDFWLYAGALETYKNVELAIAAADRAGARLVIVGDGSDADRLRELADPSVTFTGHISNESLRDLYRRARLLVFPQCEDFGIVAVEAQACGTPVVAFGRGGALDSVIDGLTGALFFEPTVDALLSAVQRCPEDDIACRSNAERFSEDRFTQAIRHIVAQAIAPYHELNH